MRLSYVLGLAASLSACLFFGCGDNAHEPLPTDHTADPGVAASVSFVHDGPLTLSPGESATLTIETTPPARYPVKFRLVGKSLDASLDTAKAETDDAGRATLELRAPHEATTFAVRASIEGGPSADLVVSVSGQGFATLEVLPSYQGTREVETWTALAAAGTTCGALAATLPSDPDGALTTSAAMGATLLLEDVPVGPSLAVVVRAGRFAWGCADVPSLMAGTFGKVEVPVTNRPLVTSDSDLDVTLEVMPEAAAWKAILVNTQAAMLGRFTSQGSEAATLLAAMAAALPGPEVVPGASWLGALETRLAVPGASPKLALEALAASVADGAPTLHGAVSGLDDTHGLFTLRSLGALEADAYGAPTEYLMTLEVDAQDQVHVGGTLFVMPSRYVGANLETAAALDAATPSMVEWLSAKVGCATLPIAPMSGCDAACIETACETGLSALWAEALDASASDALHGELPLMMTGAAAFDEDAHLTGFEGSWLGMLSVGASKAKVSGSAIAVQATDAPAN